MNRMRQSKSVANIRYFSDQVVDLKTKQQIICKGPQEINAKTMRHYPLTFIRNKNQQTKYNNSPTKFSHMQNKIKEQILILQNQMQLQDYGSAKNYDKQFQLYDITVKKLGRCQLQVIKKQQQYQQLNNTLKMIIEDYRSNCQNLKQQIIEKQYYQDVIRMYQLQYQNQSQLVLKLAELTNNNQITRKSIKEHQEQIIKFNFNIDEWKKQNNFDATDKKINSTLTFLRVQFMEIEQNVDILSDGKIPKMRQLICMFIQKSNGSKKQLLKKKQMDEGIQIYICKQQKICQFRYFLNDKIKQCGNECLEEIQKLLKCLQKIQKIINSKVIKDRKTLEIYNKQLGNKLCQIHQKEDQIKVNQQKIVQINQKLEGLFNQEALIQIQQIKDNVKLISLKQIKQKLKWIRQQQLNRVNKIKFYYNKCVNFTLLKSKRYESEVNKQIYRLRQSLVLLEQSVLKSKEELSRVKNQKYAIEEKINNVVQKWKDYSQKKKKLKKLYKSMVKPQAMFQLNKINIIKENKTITLPHCQLALSFQKKNLNLNKQNTLATPNLKSNCKSNINLSTGQLLTKLLISKLIR